MKPERKLKRMNKATSIFYVNSAGMMCQWKGFVIAKDNTSISIRFSKNKACRYNLKDLDIDFLIVTNVPVTDLGVCVSKAKTSISFDDNVKKHVIDNTVGNVAMMWQDGKWSS
jgi:hypothetical protein